MAGISRQHFFLEWRDSGDSGDSAVGTDTEILVLRDNKSVNGVAVNRKRVLESRLEVGDLIAVGLGRHVKVGELASPHDNVSLRVCQQKKVLGWPHVVLCAVTLAAVSLTHTFVRSSLLVRLHLIVLFRV